MERNMYMVKYEAPMMEVLEVEVEKGFNASNAGGYAPGSDEE